MSSSQFPPIPTTPAPAHSTDDASWAIEAQGLGKTYTVHQQQPGLRGALRAFVRRVNEDRVALHDLDLTVPRGQIVGLLGPNGAGKTTTVKMCVGLLKPTHGQVRVLGHDPQRRGFDFLRRISVVFGQKTMLTWDVPTFDSLLVHRQMYDLDRATFDRSVAELGAMLDVTDLLHTPVRKLSLGQRMRCELMLSLLHQPELLFADEPTIGLDVVAKATLRAFLARINAELGTTIVLTSHDMDDVEALCQRIVLIDRGALRFDGDVAGLRARVRPLKRIVVSYLDAVTPLTTHDLPPGCRVVEASERLLVAEAPPAEVAELARRALTRGVVDDLQVTEADLDDVMKQVFGA